jgi:hypothetical protein
MGRKRIVLDRQSDKPYLERYYIFLRDRKRFPFNIFLHKFLRSDPDDVHDHPWPYVTIILKGGYYEYIPNFSPEGVIIGHTRYWRGPGTFRISRSISYHRIELVESIECWTLFIPGPQRREWGFLVDNKWIHNEQYLEERVIK